MVKIRKTMFIGSFETQHRLQLLKLQSSGPSCFTLPYGWLVYRMGGQLVYLQMMISSSSSCPILWTSHFGCQHSLILMGQGYGGWLDQIRPETKQSFFVKMFTSKYLFGSQRRKVERLTYSRKFSVQVWAKLDLTFYLDSSFRNFRIKYQKSSQVNLKHFFELSAVNHLKSFLGNNPGKLFCQIKGFSLQE